LSQVAKFKPLVKDGRLVPHMVFVNSMSDLHHEIIPDRFLDQVYDAMESAPSTIFQILTKRPGPMQRFLRRRYGDSGAAPSNLWFGVSVENDDVRKRIDVLLAIKQRHAVSCAFLSVEPLIGPIDRCDFTGMDWVLIGGESGARCRPMKEDWLKTAVDKSRAAGAAIWFKQYGHARNNPVVANIAGCERLPLTRAFSIAVERKLELAPDEQGGATWKGRLYRTLPTVWSARAAALNAQYRHRFVAREAET
jgi:protein gp37